jgi:hypothetical protein
MMMDGGREGADSRIARPHFLPPIRLTHDHNTMAEESIFNPETVIQRVAKVRNQWLANKSHPKSWKDADALVIVQGKFGEDVYHKPRIYQQYLLN